MPIFGNLPVWAVLLIVLLVSATLIVLNMAWLLQAKGMVDQLARQRQERERRPRAQR
ncbi:MAG: hypothetical protein HY690_16035 [Chloroflexi bacterium]|nr:hypothetical protein [Chloroflexota bacterium]